MEFQEGTLSVILYTDLANILKVLVTDIDVEILFWEGKGQPEMEEKEILSQIKWVWYSAEVTNKSMRHLLDYWTNNTGRKFTN